MENFKLCSLIINIVIFAAILTVLPACTSGGTAPDIDAAENTASNETFASDYESKGDYKDYTMYYNEKFTADMSPALVLAGGEYIVADAVLDTNGLERFGPQNQQKDCSAAIQNAIYAVYNAGGGTVYLPEGVYSIGSPITVLPYTTLSGAGGGTVIAVYTEPSENELPALFTLGGSGGVRDLTVYYPKQSIKNPLAYPFTFFIPGTGEGGNPANYMLSSIERVKVVNGWRGVVASKYNNFVNEQIYIKDLCGTFLETGLELYNSADASVFCDIKISPSVWSSFDAGKYGFKAPPGPNEISSYTSANLTAFILGDLEWSQWQNISAEHCMHGMRTVSGARASLSGIFYSLSLTNCRYGLTVEDMDIRKGFSLAFTGGEIGGAEYAVKNDTMGKVSFVDTVLTGKITGAGARRIVIEDFSLVFPADPKKPEYEQIPALTVISADNTARTDAAPAIQAALDEAALSGGRGIVYLPPGRYRLEGVLKVPDNIELRGSGSLPTRDQMECSLGTMLFFYKIKGGFESDAFITLCENSGISNIRAFCADTNQFNAYMKGSFAAQPPVVRITGSHSVVKNFATAGTLHGITADNAEGTFIDAISTACYVSCININGGSAYISRVLSNFTVGLRNGWWKYDNYHAMFPSGWEKNAEVSLAEGDEITPFHVAMDNLTEIAVAGGADVRAENIFSYAAKTTLSCTGSRVTAIGLGRDCYYEYIVHETNPTIKVSDGGEVTVYNLHRFNGISYIWDKSGRLEIYNRSTIYEDEDSFTGKDQVSIPFNTDNKHKSAFLIDDCDSESGWRRAKLDTDEYAQGKASIKTDSSDLLQLEKKFSALDLSNYRSGYVYFNVYIEDASLLAGNSFLELTSSGTSDKNEIAWGLGNSLFKSGWNEIILNVSDGVFTGGEPDFTKINYIRLYMFTNGENTLRLDNIKIGSIEDFN